MHFESRYWSIDQLLNQTESKNILELSSGYSVRGLDMCTRKPVHYIDTDLPDVIATKRQLIAQVGVESDLEGQLDLVSLNAMDASEFGVVAGKFGPGAITVVNEGLLMYLNTTEKTQLCRTIRDVLKESGGYWITADVYVKRPEDMRASIPQSRKEAAFFEQHNIEENKFDSYEQADSFFKAQGFELVKEAKIDFRELSVMPYLAETLPPEFRDRREPPPKIQATWMLKAT
jgi:O-methyltransferase involved in polyketide biosynthesis